MQVLAHLFASYLIRCFGDAEVLSEPKAELQLSVTVLSHTDGFFGAAGCG